MEILIWAAAEIDHLSTQIDRLEDLLAKMDSKLGAGASGDVELND